MNINLLRHCAGRVLPLLLTGVVMAAALPSTGAEPLRYVKYVNPMIGAGGHGHVFVGASVPFGSIQLGPTNINKGWDWCSGYHYSDSIAFSFSHNHLSGTGCADLGDVGIMPFTGALRSGRGQQNNIEGSVAAKYRHANEKVAPGYYSVKLDNGISAELTATTHVGMHHYVYPAVSGHRMTIDLVDDINGDVYESYIRKVDDYTVEGFRFVHAWTPLRKTFFYARFNQKIKQLDTYSVDAHVGQDELQSARVKGVVTFDDNVSDVMVKVALSSVSCEGAKKNMDAELPGWDFQATLAAAQQKWDKELSCIDVTGTPEQKTIFYTALYHTMIYPCIYADVDGSFRGMDDKVYTGNSWQNYTVFSTWDTYRALHPLYTIIERDRVPDMINSFLSIYDQNGKLPIWPLYAGETNCMPGYSSVPIIADAYLKGIRGYDADRALRYMVSTATNPEQRGISLLMKYGYIPADKLGEATSVSLEYAADDWGLALMAKRMGHDDIYRTFIKRGHAYEQYWDKRINKIHPKMADGSWYEPYDLYTAEHHGGVGDFTEGNGWQYTFMVPQDPVGLIAVNGGDKAFIENLDSLFVAKGSLGENAAPDVSGLVGMYSHGNEPAHHMPYLYVYAGAQWKTAARVRSLQEQFYRNDPDGYCGNEDCGQMSAWHILSALGFYQVTPSQGVYSFGSPLFRSAVIRLPGGKTFTVKAPANSSRNIYIRSAKLNGKNYTKSYITYDDIMRGGVLEFTMSSRPNRSFGAAPKDRPTVAQ